MSLDVYLELEGNQDARTVIPFRENGQMVELTREEWDARFPGKEPVSVTVEAKEVYWANITHNLNKMADEAGVYMYLWRPDELDIKMAQELIAPLSAGLVVLESDPDRFRTFNPSNGWGDYEGLVEFVRNYLDACERWPRAKVSVWR